MAKKAKKKNSLKQYAQLTWSAVTNPIHLIMAAFVIVAIIFYLRLYDLQVVNGREYREQVLSQYHKTSRDTTAVRGDIFFTNKNGETVLAAGQTQNYTLTVNPQRITDPQSTFDELSKHVDLDKQRAVALMSKANDPYEELKKDVPKETALAIADLGLKGVLMAESRERYYPGDELAAPVLGFMSYNGDDYEGTYGLEKQYNEVLERTQSQSTLGLLEGFLGAATKQGGEALADSGERLLSREGSLVTTIEPTVQAFIEQELKKIDQNYNSQYSAAIVMDPENGEIVTMAQSDGFNPNESRQHYRNHLVEDRLELGSIIKPLTVAIGLEEDVINRDFTYNDTGSIQYGRYTVRNFDGRGRGPATTLQTILTNSLNTGVAIIAGRLDPTDLYIYFSALGLGVETGVDLPGEVYGFIDSLSTEREIEIATASFGQGVAFTPLAATKALASLANNGVMPTPHLGSRIEYGDLIPSRVHRNQEGEQVFSAQTVKTVTDMLVNIVDDSDTFRPYSDPNFAVAIKTGTAEIPDPTGGYYSDRYLHTMMGYFPAYAEPGDQKFFILYLTMKPQGARYSSTTLKDPFFNTVQFLKNYYELKPDRSADNQLEL